MDDSEHSKITAYNVIRFLTIKISFSILKIAKSELIVSIEQA